MSINTRLSQTFMDTVPYALRKTKDKLKQLQVIAYIMQKHPSQFEEFIEKFGLDKYEEIVPKC